MPTEVFVFIIALLFVFFLSAIIFRYLEGAGKHHDAKCPHCNGTGKKGYYFTLGSGNRKLGNNLFMMSQTEIYKEMRKSESLLERRFDTILLSICTAAVLGMFGFLWTMNARMAVAEERDRAKNELIIKMQADVNSLRLDMQDIKLKVAELQLIKDQNH